MRIDSVSENDIEGVFVDAGMNVMERSGDCAGFFVLAEDYCSEFHTIGGRPAVYPYVPGDLLKRDDETGLQLSTGLVIRKIAHSGNPVKLTSSYSTLVESDLPFHIKPNGGATFPLDDGGWVYISGSQRANGKGGVYALIFDSEGNVRDYQIRLQGTSRNNNGGVSPASTYISCEVALSGQCWQVHPLGEREPEETILGGSEGGFLESVVSIRDALQFSEYTMSIISHWLVV